MCNTPADTLPLSLDVLIGEAKWNKYVYSVLFFFSRFESSSHAISMSAYLREQRRELYSKSGELQGEQVQIIPGK